jgi:DNA-binding CsgD family transcriptional regulator
VVVVDLRPNGVVRLGGEEWSATSAGGPVPAGAAVEVVERVGLRLTVRGLGDPPAAAEAPIAVATDPARGQNTEPGGSAERAATPGVLDPGPAGLAPLTPREREVAALIARGLTNRQIAGELVVAETTVDRHVSHILGKLGFATRAQVAVWVAQRQTQGASPGLR